MIHISEQEVNSPTNVSFCDSHLETRIQLENSKNSQDDQSVRAVNSEGRKLLITLKKGPETHKSLKNMQKSIPINKRLAGESINQT